MSVLHPVQLLLILNVSVKFWAALADWLVWWAGCAAAGEGPATPGERLMSPGEEEEPGSQDDSGIGCVTPAEEADQPDNFS